MNKIFQLILVSLTLSGCVYFENPEEGVKKSYVTAEVAQGLAQKDECCKALNEIDYKTAKIGKVQKHKITPKTDAYTFESGKSYFVAYRLPDDGSPLELNIKSVFSGTFFYPKVLVLDANYKIIQSYESEAFEYVPHGTFDHGSMQGKIKLQPSEAEQRYVIILTTDELRTRKLMTTTKGRLHYVGEVAMYEPTATRFREPSPEGVLRVSFTDASET